jgi:hypothetical protein
VFAYLSDNHAYLTDNHVLAYVSIDACTKQKYGQTNTHDSQTNTHDSHIRTYIFRQALFFPLHLRYLR